MKYISIIILTSLLIITPSCNEKKSDIDWEEEISKREYIIPSIEALTDVIVDNIFSPPVSSRIYAYSLIAAYECVRHTDKNLQSYAGQLNGLSEIPQPSNPDINFNLAAITAFNKMAQRLIFTEDMLLDKLKVQDSIINTLNIPQNVIAASDSYADLVVSAIVAWMKEDNYHELRSAPKYNVDFDNAGRWTPTPPAFIEAIEPSWNKVRPMVIKSADQFRPSPPLKFDLDKNSPFFQSVMEVYDISKNLTPEQKEIAGFWDCNPYTMHVTGHVMIATKKISPGGHWINIGIIACKKAEASMVKTLEILSQLSVYLFDGFISCWDEKYRSMLVRPETVINKNIDSDWRPLLQTPPFPEHTSGHSVISTAAAECLTKLLGDNFEFVDDSELRYGLSERQFSSFRKAASEAAMSRLYGGIHYRAAIENGVNQGLEVGAYISSQLNLR